MQTCCPGVADEETPAWGVIARHRYRCRTEIKADILLNSLLQEQRGELARAATNLEYPADTRLAEPIHDHRPEKIINRTVIRLVIGLAFG